jgi:Fe-Mn family superoxide dismutase
MSFTLPPLPYAPTALAPVISEETIEYHYGKHHQAYVTNLNNLTEGTPFADARLEQVILEAEPGGVFNNAAQIWNHTFYWDSMHPEGGGAPTGALSDALEASFGSFDAFQQAIAGAAKTVFGSGWTWLTLQPDGSLAIEQTANADLPLKHGRTALLTLDVWEHAYYIDYRNARPAYVDAWIERIVNWEFAAANYEAALAEARP